MTRPDQTQDIVVVGAGIIGATIAFELQRRGRRVTLVDKGDPGRGTSFGNMASIAVDFAAGSGPSTWRRIPGWLLDPQGPVWLRAPYAPKMLPWFVRFIAAGRPSRLRQIEDAGMALSAHALGDMQALLAAIGKPGTLTDDGCLAIYETEAEFAADRGHLRLMERYGVAHRVVSGAELQALEPSLSPAIAKAVLLPDNRSIRNPYQLVVDTVDAAKALGTTVLSGSVTTLERGADGPVTVILDDGRRIEAASVVLAAGVLTRRLATQLGEPIPLETERGYHTQIMKPGISMRHAIIWPHRAFMVTPTAGGIRVGGNVEFAGLEAAPDYRRARVLVKHAQRALPGLLAEETREWMGHRPSLPDTIPIISASSTMAGVWYATGHGHLGLTLSATTARLMAEMVTGQPTDVEMAPFSIRRY